MGGAYAASPTDVESRRQALESLIKQQWEYTMRTSPEWASMIGDKRYNDKLSDFSQAALDADAKQTAVFLKQFEAIDSTGFPVQEQINKDLMVRNLRLSVEGQRFKNH